MSAGAVHRTALWAAGKARARPRPASFSGGWRLGLLALLAGPGCITVPDAKVWNIEQVHDTDGTPRRYGSVVRDLEFQIRRALSSANFGAEFNQRPPEPIEDPLGVCLKNVIGLAGTSHADRRGFGRKVAIFTWLGGDCTYVLTRERCMLELVELGTQVQAAGPRQAPPADVALGPEELIEILGELVRAADPLLVGGDAEPAQEAKLRAACGAIQADRLDREGAWRVMSTLNALLTRGNFAGPSVLPLAELFDQVALACIELALNAGLQDDEGVVRAAAIESSVRMTNNRLGMILRAGLSDPDEVVVERALSLVAELGLPAVEEDFQGDALQYEEAWLDLLVRVLRVAFDGPVAVSACRAIARVSGRPRNLRPEVWVDWWEDRLAAQAEL